MRDYLQCITTFKLPEFLVQNSLSAPTQVFEEYGLEYPPSPKKKKIWSGLGTLGLSRSGVAPPPPPAKKDLCGSWCVETNRCIPQRYRLVKTVFV